MNRRGKRGFTLIELLVVIAIIAILAAILFPVFSRAREKARTASCQSNLKQLALAMRMYSNDWDEQFPEWNWGRDRNTPWARIWYWQIFPYVKNRDVYRCPSRPHHDVTYYHNPRFPWSYGYNEPISAGCCGGRGNDIPQMTHIAEVLLLGDCRHCLGGWHPGPEGLLWRYIVIRRWLNCRCGSGPDRTLLQQYGDEVPPHSGGSNIAFADGHVKWMQWRNIKIKSKGGPIRYRVKEF